MDIVLGNSLVKHLLIPGLHIISVNGLDWEGAILYMMKNRDLFMYKTVFIVIGPLRFTRRTQPRKEIILATRGLSSVYDLFSPFFTDLQFLHIRPVICPLYPMHFGTYNWKACRRPIMTSFYDEWDIEIHTLIIQQNQEIVAFNFNNHSITPNLNRKILHRLRGAFRFRPHHTTDGLHVTNQILTEWAREFQRVHTIMSNGSR